MSAFIDFISLCKQVKPILEEIIKNGGRPYLVGGIVRDLVLNKSLKDTDVEIHKISLEDLERILKKIGIVRLVGKQFGVLRIDHLDVDWSIPRRDSKGRKPNVEFDSTMTIEEACKRRDLTMNAMAIDLSFVCQHFMEIEKDPKILTIIDPYGGLTDMQKNIMRAVDRHLFTEDPLRFFRVMQFVGRFEMQPDDELNEICRKMVLNDFEQGISISKERIYEEIRKLLLKSVHPSLGFRWLQQIGRLEEIFPELYALTKTPQRSDHHPEGNVFEHTMQALDAAAQFDGYEKVDTGDEKFLIELAMLCHDLGKPQTTDDLLKSKGHAEAGLAPSKLFLRRFIDSSFLIAAVCKLVKYHILPFEFVKTGVSDKAYKRLAAKLAPETTLRHLAIIALCDLSGRNPASPNPVKWRDDVFKPFLERALKAEVANGPEEPFLLGRHLINEINPGPQMGELLKMAYEIQIEEGIKDWQELKRRVLQAGRKVA